MSGIRVKRKIENPETFPITDAEMEGDDVLIPMGCLAMPGNIMFERPAWTTKCFGMLEFAPIEVERIWGGLGETPVKTVQEEEDTPVLIVSGLSPYFDLISMFEGMSGKIKIPSYIFRPNRMEEELAYDPDSFDDIIVYRQDEMTDQEREHFSYLSTKQSKHLDRSKPNERRFKSRRNR